MVPSETKRPKTDLALPGDDVNPVAITITNKKVGTALVTTYDKNLDPPRLYYRPTLPSLKERYQGKRIVVLYEVNTYAVQVKGGKVYEAVRYGVRTPRGRKETDFPPRVVDPEGLSAANLFPEAAWDDYFGGSWRLRPSSPFLIHRGPKDRTEFMGDLGCIEIVGKWDEFVKEVSTIAGVPKNRTKLSVTLEQAEFPRSILAIPRSVIIPCLPNDMELHKCVTPDL